MSRDFFCNCSPRSLLIASDLRILLESARAIDRKSPGKNLCMEWIFCNPFWERLGAIKNILTNPDNKFPEITRYQTVIALIEAVHFLAKNHAIPVAYNRDWIRALAKEFFTSNAVSEERDPAIWNYLFGADVSIEGLLYDPMQSGPYQSPGVSL